MPPIVGVPAFARWLAGPSCRITWPTWNSRSVRISHEALLSHWTRLQGWVIEGRVDLALVERLRRAAQGVARQWPLA